MPMKTFKGNKNNKTPKLKRNVPKGYVNKLESEFKKQDLRNSQIWESQRKKYEYRNNE